MSRCANSREPAMQTWPELAKIAVAAPCAVLPMSTSGRTMTGDLPPSSRVTRFSVSVAFAVDDLADLGRAGEGDLVDVRMADHAVAGGLAQAGDEVEHAGRDARFGDEVGEAQRGQRRLLGGLEDRRCSRRRARARSSAPPSSAGSSTARSARRRRSARAGHKRGTRPPGRWTARHGRRSIWSPMPAM